MSFLRACADWRAIVLLVAMGAGVAALAPNLIGAAIPLLLVAACPLSMLVMMRAMASHPGLPSATSVDGTGPDRPSRLRERLASTRLEQDRLERELAQAESAERSAVVEASATLR